MAFLRGVRRHALTLAVGAAAFYAAVAFFPTPAELLSDHGNGYQLAGASEILAGRHPFIDFKDIYGPLVHYASAAAQWLAGGRVGGELALASLAIAIGFMILFRAMRACGISGWLALGMTLVAVAVQPVGWRYYMLLLPMIFIAAAWRYVDAPGWARLGATACTVTLAGLFRPDLGVFTYLAGLVLLASIEQNGGRVLTRFAVFTATVIVFAVPWLVRLAWHGKLGDYFANSSIDALRDAVGMARPAPAFDFSATWFSGSNLKAGLFRLPTIMLVLSGVVLFIERHRLNGALRARLHCAFALAALSQFQASHIVDWIHVRDTVPLRILLFAWVATVAGGGRYFRAISRGVVALVAVALLAAAGAKETRGDFRPGAVWRKLRDYDCSRDGLLAQVRMANGNFRARLYEYVRDHSAPDEAVLAVIEAPELNYFANRRLGGGQLALLPGYFANPPDQAELIARLRTDRTAFVIVDHVGQPEYPDLALKKFAPEFWAFLGRDFVEVARIGYCRVLEPRWRIGVRQRDGK